MKFFKVKLKKILPAPLLKLLKFIKPDFIMLSCACFVILSFIPIVFDIPLVRPHSTLLHSLESPRMMFVYGVTFSACLSMIVDLLLDILYKASKTRFLVRERLLILITVIIIPIIYFLVKPKTTKQAIVFVCLFTAQRIAIVAPLLRSLSLSPSKIFNDQFGLLIFLMFGTVQILIEYWGLYREEGQKYLSVFVCSWILIAMSVIYFFWYFLPYCFHLLGSSQISEDEFIPLTFGGLLVSYALCLLLLNTAGAQAYADFTVQLIGISNAALVITAVVATVLPGRIARSELADRERMIELKRNFVRYISHEIRTPINISLLGLEVLEKSLTSNDDSMEVVKSIKDAITSATDILNDLLTYEKITSNLMTLERTLEVPLDIVVDTVKLFGIGAQSKEIELIVECPKEYDHWLLTNMRIDIDKFKMIQVIRNFMSNAIKFTPVNGRVTVRLTTFRPSDEEFTTKSIEDRSTNRYFSLRRVQSFHTSVHNTYRKVAVAAINTLPSVSVHNNNSINHSNIQNSSLLNGNSMSISGNNANNNNNSSSHTNSNYNSNNLGSTSIQSNSVEIDSLANLWVRICFIDTGPGIAPQNISRVFKEVIQFDANKLQAGKGSGLGLFISKGICNLHNAQVYVRSGGLGKGCIFYLEIPLVNVLNMNSGKSLKDIPKRRGSFEHSINNPFYINRINSRFGNHNNQTATTATANSCNGNNNNGRLSELFSLSNANNNNNNNSNNSNSRNSSCGRLGDSPVRRSSFLHSVDSKGDLREDSIAENSERLDKVTNLPLQLDYNRNALTEITSDRSDMTVRLDSARNSSVLKYNPRSGSSFDSNKTWTDATFSKSSTITDIYVPDVNSRSQDDKSGSNQSLDGSISSSAVRAKPALSSGNGIALFNTSKNKDGMVDIDSGEEKDSYHRKANSNKNTLGNNDNNTRRVKMISVGSNNSNTDVSTENEILEVGKASRLVSNSNMSTTTKSSSNTAVNPVIAQLDSSSNTNSNRGSPRNLKSFFRLNSSSNQTNSHNNNSNNSNNNSESYSISSNHQQQPPNLPYNPSESTASDELYIAGKTLLVVDDSVVNLKMIVLFFKKLGANVVQATDGKDAVEIIRKSLGLNASSSYLPAKLLPSVSSTFGTSFGKHHNSSLMNSAAGSSSNNGGFAAQIQRQSSASSSSTTTSAATAVVTAASDPTIDLVVMDNLMNFMNGPEAAKAMRDIGYTGPIFGLTGHALRDDVNHYIRCGANTVFKKPIDIKQFCRIFRNYVDGVSISHEIESMYLD